VNFFTEWLFVRKSKKTAKVPFVHPKPSSFPYISVSLGNEIDPSTAQSKHNSAVGEAKTTFGPKEKRTNIKKI
jgi:hypothetical protein